MRGGLGVAKQHHVILDPTLAADHREIAPHRAVSQELMPFEEPAKNAGHPIGGLLLVQTLEPGAFEGCRIGLEDPGRASYFVLIGMGDKRSPLGLLKDKRESV